jgi:glutathione peroxidase-family protein
LNTPSTQKLTQKYVEIVNPSGFVNSKNKPITIGEYVGKQVILLNVMTYSCSNCQATFPYVNTWYEMYKDEGLIVIGLHTPEFAFEKDKQNVIDAMKKYGITYPIVMDNEYSTWNALGNRFWPRKYLIDIHGDVVFDHIGEGAYEETEVKIKELLLERKEILDL